MSAWSRRGFQTYILSRPAQLCGRRIAASPTGPKPTQGWTVRGDASPFRLLDLGLKRLRTHSINREPGASR
jgi:hypothetical protein